MAHKATRETRGSAGIVMTNGHYGEANGRPHGLVFLFERGNRPDRADVLAKLKDLPRVSVSHDPASGGVDQSPSREGETSEDWLELLLDGLTFDLIGLPPGPALPTPSIDYHFNCEAAGLDRTEALGLFPGPHIASGLHSLPVLRTLLRLGAALTDGTRGLRAVCWTPAATAIAPQFFVRTARTWLEGGAFPALGMMGLFVAADGTMRSHGLAFLIGQELALDPVLAADRTAATRLATRVVHELVGYELPSEPLRFVIDGSGELELVPDLAAGFVRVRPA